MAQPLTLEALWKDLLPAAEEASPTGREEVLDSRNEVQYLRLPCRSVLNRCPSEQVPFAYTINPYRGCEFGCAYCYARYTHEYLGWEGGQDFERTVYVKERAGEVLARELGRKNLRGHLIAIGPATDPYQPAERRYEVTRDILKALSHHRRLWLSLTTKSDLLLRDLDLLQTIHARSHLCVNVTITTVDLHLARRLEPRAPTPEKRLKAVRELAQAGLNVGLFLMPLLPFLNDDEAGLETLMAQARDTGAQYVVPGLLRLRSAARKRFFPWLEQNFPELSPTYRRLFAQTLCLRAGDAQEILARVERLRHRYGLAAGPPAPGKGAPSDLPAQLSLPLA